MPDLTNPKLLWLKGGLFVFLGLLASAVLLLLHPAWTNALLLALAIWAFCRAYYFAFYVIEHYIDPHYKFAGLTAFLRYALRPRPKK